MEWAEINNVETVLKAQLKKAVEKVDSLRVSRITSPRKSAV